MEQSEPMKDSELDRYCSQVETEMSSLNHAIKKLIGGLEKFRVPGTKIEEKPTLDTQHQMSSHASQLCRWADGAKEMRESLECLMNELEI